MRRRRRAIRGWILLAAIGSSATAAPAQTPSAPALKAAFILNFARFAEWPLGARPPGAPVRACVLGDPQVAKALEETARREKARDAQLHVSEPEPETAADCDLVYASGLDRTQMAIVLAATRGAPVLTVSDTDGFTRNGGMVELFQKDGRMRFAIHPESLQRSRLRMSAQVLSLASVVGERR